MENKPYIDLRPMHFGIVIGFNTQDIELENVGPQTYIRIFPGSIGTNSSFLMLRVLKIFITVSYLIQIDQI